MMGGGRLLIAMRRLKAYGWDKIEEWNSILDAESRRRFLQEIQQKDECTEEEAWRKIREEPKYSIGYKMCSPAMVMALTTKKGKAQFKELLTPEEAKLFDEEFAKRIRKSDISKEYIKQKGKK